MPVIDFGVIGDFPMLAKKFGFRYLFRTRDCPVLTCIDPVCQQ